jgi:hypothetical protein
MSRLLIIATTFSAMLIAGTGVARVIEFLQTPSVPSGGTQIVSVTTKDGWVVCGDKRLYDVIRGDRDVAQKVRNAGNVAIFDATGASIIADITEGDVFNAEDEVDRFLSNEKFSDEPGFWQHLLTYLSGRLKETLRIHPLSGPGGVGISFLLQFYWIDKDGTLVTLNSRVDYSDSENIRIVQTAYRSGGDDFASSGFAGEKFLYEEILSGTNPEFDDLRKDAQIKRFLERPKKLDVTSTDAEAFARRFIRLASERGPLLNPGMQHISPASDCLSLDTNGVHTLQQ